MKKLFAWVLLLTLMLGMFAGCKKTQTPTEPAEDYVTAQAAMEYLKALYKTTEEATKTPRDFERYGVIRVGGEPFEIAWTVDLDSIQVVPGEEQMVKIDIDEQCQEDTPYVLTATITDKGGNSVSHSWNYIMPKAMDVGQVLKDAYALADGESLPYEVTLTGKVISIDTMYNPEYQNITVTMVVEGYEEYPVQCYRLKGDGVDQLAVGNIITVTGTLKNYKGTIEFDYGCILESWEKGDAVDAPEDPLEIVKAAYALANGESLPYVATLTGKVIEIDTPYDPEYSNISVVMVVEGAENKPITCYRLKGTGVDQIAVDDIITVMGIIKNYKGTIEFDTGCQLMDRISGGRQAEKPSSDPAKIFADAKKLKSGQHLNYYATLTGKVTDIESPYDKEYSNITVVISVKGYASTPITCYRLKGTGVEKIARGDTITVKGIIENYKGTLEFGSGCTMLDRVSGGGVAKPETSNVKTIMTDAAKLASGEHLDYYSTLTGKVIDIESPYDKEYQNITVVMQVSGYENMPVTCYRLKSGDVYNVSKIARGDTITVRGVLENYKGKLEYGTGCTLQKRVSGGGVAKAETANVKTIMTDAAKLASGQHLDYYSSLTGKVTQIETPYDKEYGNITVIMQVSGYESTPITCYRLKDGNYKVSKIAVGDTITVRGVLENYNGKLEYGTGCTLQKRVSGGGVAKPESSDHKAILADALKLSSGEKLDYYANLTGKVTQIDTPYDKEYKNISVYMDVDGTEMLCYRLKSGDADASQITKGDTITVRGVIENYKGDIQFGTGSTLTKRVSGGGVAKPETDDQATILADAAKLGKGEHLDYYANLTGKVTQIDTPYDKEYKNISVYMDVNGTEMLCYRLKSGDADASQITKGDTITVRGVIENYKGDIQFGTGSTLTKRVSGGGVAKPETDDQATILADAAKLGKGEYLDYYSSLTGKVTQIETPYDKEYGNITVVIELNDSAKTQITCYRMKSGAADAFLVARGDTITVRGVLENYNGKLEYGTGCTLQKRVSGGGAAKPETDDAKTIFADANALANGESLDYYANLTGKVTKIDTPYDKEYGNLSVYMDVDGTSMYCYRLASGAADASLIAVGDTITVRGVIMKYKDAIQFGAGSKLTNRVSGGGTAKPETDDQAAIFADADKLASGESLSYYATLTGKVTRFRDLYDPEYGNASVYVQVGDRNLLCYRLKSGDAEITQVRVGDTITVRGVIMNYNGSIQFGSGCTVEKIVPGYNPGDNMTPEQIVDAAYALKDGEFLEGQYTLKGVISSVDEAYSSDYKNITVTIKVENRESKPIMCYRMKGTGIEDLAVNDIITVTGSIKSHYGTIEFDSGCMMLSYEKGGFNTTIKESVIVSNLKADTAYKLYVDHVGLGKELYFAGRAISPDYPFYMKTTEDSDVATDVYLEAVEGGYYLYFYSGTTKSYLDMYKDGTHYSIRIADVPSVVYTYDTTYNTLKTTLEGVECYMGSSGTYDSISGSEYSYISKNTSYPAHLAVINVRELTESELNLAPLVTEKPKDGDGVVFYYPSAAGAMGITVTGGRVDGVSTALYKDQLPVTEEMANLKVSITPEGYYTFTYGGKYLACRPTGGNLSLRAGINEYCLWTIEAAGDGLWYIKNVNAVYENNPQAIEMYSGQFTAMSFASGKESYFEMKLFSVEPDNTELLAPVTPETMTELYEEEPYKLYVEKANQEYLYFTGAVLSSDKPFYMGSTDDYYSAADVYVEEVTGGYQLYILNGETKTYLDMYKNGDYYNLRLTDAPTAVYTFDATNKTLKAKLEDQECYIGSEGTYSSISCNKYSAISDTSYFAHLCLSNNAEGSDLDPNDLAGLLEAAAQLEDGKYLRVKTSQTGVVTTVPVVYSNPTAYTFSMDVDGTVLYCYKVSFADGNVPAKGDTVTVTGKLTAIGGKPQFDATSSAVWVEAGEQENSEKTYIIGSYSKGTQYALNEEHVLDDLLTLTTNDAYFNTSSRLILYQSAGHDGTAVLKSTKTMSKLVLQMGQKTGNLQVLVSNDGQNWTPLQTVAVEQTTKTEYTVEIPNGTKYLKLDAVDSELRIYYMTVTFTED